ncbi:MAG: hypothetical protein R3F30_11155 [Planctomycetota bacterium]
MSNAWRSFGRRLTALANGLGASVTACVLVLLRLDAKILDGWHVTDGLAAGAGALLLLNACNLLYFRHREVGDDEAPIMSEGEDGPVQVAREALVHGLRLAGERVDGVQKLRIRLATQGRRKVQIRAGFQVPEGVAVQDVGRALREVLRRRFGELVRLDKESRLEVELLFEGFAGRTRQKIQPLGPRDDEGEAAEVPHFTGPRYPVDVPGEKGS